MKPGNSGQPRDKARDTAFAVRPRAGPHLQRTCKDEVWIDPDGD